jgi:hypothetical protein
MLLSCSPTCGGAFEWPLRRSSFRWFTPSKIKNTEISWVLLAV